MRLCGVLGRPFLCGIVVISVSFVTCDETSWEGGLRGRLYFDRFLCSVFFCTYGILIDRIPWIASVRIENMYFVYVVHWWLCDLVDWFVTVDTGGCGGVNGGVCNDEAAFHSIGGELCSHNSWM